MSRVNLGAGAAIRHTPEHGAPYDAVVGEHQMRVYLPVPGTPPHFVVRLYLRSGDEWLSGAPNVMEREYLSDGTYRVTQLGLLIEQGTWTAVA